MAKQKDDVFGMSYFMEELEVTDRSKRIVDNPNPEFIIVAASENSSKDRVGINAAASKLIGFGNKEYMEIVHNAAAVRKAIAEKNPMVVKWAEETGNNITDYPISYFLMKGRVKRDSAGNPITTRNKRIDMAEKRALAAELGKNVEDLTNEDYPITYAYEGFRLTANGVPAGAIGYDMYGSDSKNWRDLGGNVEQHVVYSIGEGIEHPKFGTIYPITFNRKEDKVERNS